MEILRNYLEKFLLLSDEEWLDFKECIEIEKISKKDFILKEGEKCDFIAFIQEGIFSFYNFHEGEEKITAFFFSGEFASNYRSFLTKSPSKHYIEALQDSIIYKIKLEKLIKLYDKHKSIERLGRLIAENLYLGVANRLDSFMFDSPAIRYQDLLNRNSKLISEIPQYMIASYIGVKPETLSRIRSRK